jgi:hypothetical protein
MPMKLYPNATFQYGMPSFQSSSMVVKPSSTKTWPSSRVVLN